jgi:tRNA(adenine34) deaminase
MQALREASARLGDWRLDGATLYVTLEPCPMCAGALLQGRIARLVYGAGNIRWGIDSAGLNLFNNPRFNHRVEVVGGVLQEECAALLKDTFRQYRQARK